jgi:cardiolipin synthase
MWSTERIITDGDEYFAALVADINAAATSIDLESYIVADDEIGRLVTGALATATARGVAVRLMVDGHGAQYWVHDAGQTFRGCPWRIYHPLPWLVLRTYLPTMRTLAGRWQALRWINRRNHRKTCVIDGRIAWVGSFNLERRHSRAAVGTAAWRDTAVRVEGPNVSLLTAAFHVAWSRAWRFGRRFLVPPVRNRTKPLLQPVNPPVRLNTTRRNRRRQWKQLLQRIAGAEQRVWITTPYFVPTEGLLKALESAAKRADVRLLLPLVNDVPFMPYVASVFVGRLRRAGVRIWVYPRMVHAKTQVIDGIGLVGSSNLNSRSLRFDLEADVWVDHPATLDALSTAFTADCAISRELPADVRAPWHWRLLGRLFLFGRGLL